MELHLHIVGWMLILLAIIHLAFPKYFHWKKELAQLSLINRQMVYVHTFFLALILVLAGILCVSSSKDLVETPLGNRIAFGLGIFWLIRLFTQFFIYDTKLWRGKKFETIVHVLFSIAWIYFSAVFFITAFARSPQ